MSRPSFQRHKTAIHRVDLSRPVRIALEEGIIGPKSTVLDYGCGHGDDVERLKQRKIRCVGWDPVHQPKTKRAPADVVNLAYVVNVIEDPQERADTLRRAWRLTKKALVVAARHTMEAKGTDFAAHEDGRVTGLGTFQKFYEQEELRLWIDQQLATKSIPAAPGIFYVFKDEELQESVLARRFHRRAATPRLRRSDVLFGEHRDLLEPLITFVSDRGRLPEQIELPESDAISSKLGSIKRAFAIVRRVTGNAQWDTVRDVRSQDLLVYLALARFSRRPRFSALPRPVQLDARVFFSSYKRACELADTLLFAVGDPRIVDGACRESGVGKYTGNALYIHASALEGLPPALRVYEGCARTFVGSPGEANIIKLHRDEPGVSYLSYPDFDADPHPALKDSLVVLLKDRRIRRISYVEHDNPPVLHRKEQFVAAGYPNRETFAALTEQEEKAGLYATPEFIGTRNGWLQTLRNKRAKLKGHTLRMPRPSPN